MSGRGWLIAVFAGWLIAVPESWLVAAIAMLDPRRHWEVTKRRKEHELLRTVRCNYKRLRTYGYTSDTTHGSPPGLGTHSNRLPRPPPLAGGWLIAASTGRGEAGLTGPPHDPTLPPTETPLCHLIATGIALPANTLRFPGTSWKGMQPWSILTAARVDHVCPSGTFGQPTCTSVRAHTCTHVPKTCQLTALRNMF